MDTCLLLFKYIFNDWRLGKMDLLLLNVTDDHVNFVNDLFTAPYGIEKRFVEVVWGGVNKLHEIILG